MLTAKPGGNGQPAKTRQHVDQNQSADACLLCNVLARLTQDDAPSPSEAQLRTRCSNPLTATPADLAALQNLLQNKTAVSPAVRSAQAAFVESFNAAEAGAAEFKRLTALRAVLDAATRAAGAAQAPTPVSLPLPHGWLPPATLFCSVLPSSALPYADVSACFACVQVKREGKPRDALLDMPTTEFNRYLKLSQLTTEEIQDLRKERRRKKNRLYAKRSRGKKLEIPELHRASSSASMDVSGARAHAAQRPPSLSPVAVA